MKTRTWILILLVLTLVSGGLGLLLMQPGEICTRAQVYSGGQLVKTLDLRQDQKLTVPLPDGSFNEITVSGGKAAVTDASCPDHYCMRRGFRNSGSPIICLPNALEIRFIGTSETDFDIG